MSGRQCQRGKGGKKRSAGTAINRFLEPCLLLLLCKGPSYGYELIGALRPFGLEDLAHGPVYRTLRELEAAQMILSEWDTESSAGPARRVYRLTEIGREHLASWVKLLRDTETILQSFLATYDQHISENSRKHQ